MEKSRPTTPIRISAVTSIDYATDGSPYLVVSLAEDLIEPALDKLIDLIGQNKFDEYNQNLLIRNNFKYHITVASPREWENLSSMRSSTIDLPANIELIGIGSVIKYKDETYFVICQSEDLQNIRENLKLPPRDFHITIAFKREDIHSVKKDLSTLVSPL